MKKTTTILLVLVMAILFLPLLQHAFQFVDDGKLYGDISSADNADFSIKGWWDGSYQEQKTEYLNDSVGFRASFIRSNNELDFRLFKKTHARQVVAGRDNYLYEQPYIDAYCGIDTVADEVIAQQVYKLKKVQDTILKTGTECIFVFAPSKARYYPEYFPESYNCAQPENAYYLKYLSAMDSLGVNYINFNEWFCRMRDTSSHLLMSKQGIHWTTYGAMLAADSLISYIENKLGLSMRHIVFDGIKKSIKAPHSDNDIALALNLATPVATDTFTHVSYHFTVDSTKDRPNAILIGDSFCWTYVSFNFPLNVFDSWEFWYYGHEVWSRDALLGKEPVTPFYEYDWQPTLQKSDVLIIQYTEVRLKYFTQGFIDHAYEHYYGAGV